MPDQDLCERCDVVGCSIDCMRIQKIMMEGFLERSLIALHQIGGAYQLRDHLAKDTLTAPLRASLEKKGLTDKQIEELALDTWEAVVLEIRAEKFSETNWEGAWREAIRTLRLANAKIQDLAGWSGSSGNWGLQECAVRAQKVIEIIDAPPPWQKEEEKSDL